MTPVYQNIFDQGRGNCWTAVWASLLNLQIEDVPHFIAYEDHFGELCKFLAKHGLEYERYVVNPNRKDVSIDAYDVLKHQLSDYGSIDGLFDATVYSPGYWDENRFFNDPGYKPICHAVIVDKDLNIVHDPNPKYKGMKYPLADQIGFNGVLGISLFTKIKNQ